MTPDEARAKLDEWLRAEHGLCEHDVTLTTVKGCWRRRVPCDWPDCREPVHEHAYAKARVRHVVFWPQGTEVWLKLMEERFRALAAAAERDAAQAGVGARRAQHAGSDQHQHVSALAG